MYKIGVLGKRDVILPYLSAGFSIYPTEGVDGCEKVLKSAVSDGCAIVFVTADTARACPDLLGKYKNQTLPALVVLPEGGGGLGAEMMRDAVIRAVGADIT